MQFTNHALSAMWLRVAFLLADSLMSQYLGNYKTLWIVINNNFLLNLFYKNWKFAKIFFFITYYLYPFRFVAAILFCFRIGHYIDDSFWLEKPCKIIFPRHIEYKQKVNEYKQKFQFVFNFRSKNFFYWLFSLFLW